MTKKSRLTRIAASLMAMLLVFGLFLSAAPTAYAADEGKLTIYKLDSRPYTYAEVGGTGTSGDPVNGFYYDSVSTSYYAYLKDVGYTIYKIGTVEQKTTTTAGVTTTEMVYEPVSGLQYIGGTAITSIDSTTVAGNIDTSGLTVAAAEQVTTATGALTFTTGLDEKGVYLVKETTIPASVSAGEDFIISVPLYVNGAWTKDITAYPKNTATLGSITKDVTAIGSSPVSSSSKSYNANVGDTITYSVDVSVPSDYDTNSASTLYYTKFNIVDTPSAYLEIQQSSVQVELNGSTITTGFNVAVDPSTGVLTVEFNPLTTIAANDAIKLTYDAKILAGSSGAALTNDVKVDFTTNNGSGIIIPPIIDPPPTVTTYSYGIKKVDESSAPLANAIFVLAAKDGSGNYVYYDYNPTTEVWSVAADETAAYHFTTTATNPTTPTAITDEAILQFYNLEAADSGGTAIEYYLIETTAPGGYVAPSDYSLKFTVTSATSAAVANTYDTTGATPVYNVDTGYTTQIKNVKSGSDIIGNYLPSTGGTGTLMFLIIGLLLIAGAVTLYVRSRRSDKKSAN
ncbi:MAG: SpaH/EbpB family LPXTG-anchored major pilin [Lachnospiraceae bacterium]